MKRSGSFIEDMKWPEVAEAFRTKTPILIPIGALAKEHGYHLPMSNDYWLARKMAEKIIDSLPILIAPIVGFGYYPAFQDYPGSQHLKASTFIALLTDLIENYIDQGSDRIALLNTGYSTEGPIGLVLEDIFARRGVKIHCLDLRLLHKDRHKLLTQRRGSHADEHETSLMLHLIPDQVAMDRAIPDYGEEEGHPFRSAARLNTKSGAFGDPTLADAEKGRKLFDAIINEIISGLKDIFEI